MRLTSSPETHKPESFQLPLTTGTIAGLRWGQGERKVLALHGWLDNAASFDCLGPLLAGQGIEVWAIDLPGHGFSDHIPEGWVYHLPDYLIVLDQVIDALDWPETCLLAHSLGGVVALLYAAASDRLSRLMVLDALGAMPGKAEDAAEHLEKTLSLARRPKNRSKAYYAELEPLIQERMKGFGGLSYQSSKRILLRNLIEEPQGYRWRSDSRLRWPSMQRLTEEQVQACLKAIRTPVDLVFATEGFFNDVSKRQPRLGLIEHRRCWDVKGPHHVHMDGDLEVLARIITEHWLS